MSSRSFEGSHSDGKDFVPIDLDKFKKINKIGEGSFAKIYTVKEKETNKIYVAKVLNHMGNDELSLMKSFYSEVEIMSKFNSPFIVKFVGYSLKDFKGRQSPTIITEFVPNGSLFDLLEQVRNGFAPKEWNATRILITIYSIALGMATVHSKNIIHRDLKPSNILLDEHFLPKICDFGLSVFDTGVFEKDMVGTPAYIAPEAISKYEYTKAVDVYAFALIVNEIITLKNPYKKCNVFIECYKKMHDREGPKIDDDVPESYKRLITKCWQQDPKDRPTFEQIVLMLKTDKGFITDDVDEKEFLDFIDRIENNESQGNFEFEEIHIDYNQGKELSVDFDEINLNLFEKIAKVGEGQYGEVFKVRDKRNDSLYAAKVNQLLIENCTFAQMKCLSREINILAKLNSPLVVKFIGFNRKNFEGEKRPTIITEFIKNTSLYKIIELNNRGMKPSEWNDTKLLIVTYGIASGMAHLHSLNILHRDLKPDNIFLDEYLFPKIGDFGFSKEIEDDNKPHTSYDKVGTPAFMAPEIFERFEYSKASDVYAFSILLYEITTFDLPYEGFNALNLPPNVMKGLRPVFNVNIPKCYRKLIERCWQQEREKRPTFREIVELLRNDKEFITDEVDEDEFLKYVKFVDDNILDKSFKEVTIDLEELNRIQEKDPLLNVPYIDISLFEKLRLIKKIDNFDIFEIQNTETNEHFEAKISTVRITKLSIKEIIHLSREINILSKLIHPSFLKFIGFSPIDFNKHPLPVLISEMPPNKSLEHLLNKERSGEHIELWNDTKKLICIYGIASGMSFLHLYDILHRNLCPESIFFDEFMFPKIGNFGLLTKIHAIESMQIQSSIGIKGSPSYSSPELLESGEYSKNSDVYSFSFIVYELMTLQIPFEDIDTITGLYHEVVTLGKRPQFKIDVAEPYRKLIESCWSQNPLERPSFDEIKSKLKNDDGFITEKVDRETFQQYVKFIEQSHKAFYSQNRVVRYDNLIDNKHSIPDTAETQNEDKNMTTQNRDDESESINRSKIQDDFSLTKNASNSVTKSKIDDSITPEISDEIENLIERLSNKECIGKFGSDLLDYLLNESDQISTSTTFTTFKFECSETRDEADSVLIKVFNEIMIELKKCHEFIIEYKKVNELNHPNISKALGFFEGNSKKHQPSILFPFYSRSLKDSIQTLEDVYLVSIIYEISHAMMTAHSNKIIHRNLNPENILIDFENHVKITEFGIPILIDTTEQSNLNYTVFCLPKEILENKEYNEKVDVFSFGVIMLFILTRGKGLFYRETISRMEGKRRYQKS